jgi:hypothetical protein
MTINSSSDHLNPKLVQAAREAFLRTNLDKSAASSPTKINRTKVSDQISAQERLFQANKKHLLKSQILTHSQTGSSSNKNVCFTKSIAKLPSNKAGENDQALLPASFILSPNSLQISQNMQSFSSSAPIFFNKKQGGLQIEFDIPKEDDGSLETTKAIAEDKPLRVCTLGTTPATSYKQASTKRAWIRALSAIAAFSLCVRVM